MQSLESKRQYYNEQILSLLSEYLSAEGQELRFAQLMYILDQCRDYFLEEPWETLTRYREQLHAMKAQSSK